MGIDEAKDTAIRRRVFVGTASNFVGKIISLGTWFILTPFILHQLGDTTYGLWVLVGSIVAYGYLLDLGVAGAVIKYVAEYHAKGEIANARSLVATALCLYSVLGLTAIALSAVIAPAFPYLFNVPPNDRTTATGLVLLMGLGIGVSIPCAIPMAILKGLQRFDLANLISIIGTILSAAATVAVLLLGGGVLGMATVGIFTTLAMQAPSIWLIKHTVPKLRFGWRGASRQLVRTVFSFSSPIFVMDVTGRLQRKTDEIVIAAFLPFSAVTPYAIARGLSEMPLILTDQFMKVLPPLASELNAAEETARMRSLCMTGTRLTLAMFLPVGCTLIVLAQSILTVWVGAAYADFSQLVLILTLAYCIDASHWPAGAVLQGMARHRPLAMMWVGAALANVALSILLVQDFGLTGVALGTLLPTVVVSVGFILPYAMWTLGVSMTELLKQICLPTLLPVVPMAVVLYILQHAIEPSSLLSIMVVAGIGVLVYVIGYLNWGASEVERQTCRSLVLSTIRFAEACLKRS